MPRDVQLLDIRAKERLTGAVILVALIVLVVPELLSGRAHRAAQPAAAGEEAPLRSVTVDLGEEPRGAAAVRPEAEDLSAPSKEAVPSPEEASSASSSAVQPPPLETPPALRTHQAAQSALRARALQPAEAQPLGGSATLRNPASSGGPARPSAAVRSPPRGSRSSWWVQVGSFESRERADRYVHRLKVEGFAASLSQGASHGRKWYRVRVGPERDRAAARALAVRLHSAGQPGSVMPP
jgi:DedD protein